MTKLTSPAIRALLALALAVLAALGAAGAAGATPASPTATALPSAASAQASCGDTAGFDVVALSDLPPEATDTVELIERGGPYPYPQDGTVFSNRESLLPACSRGYYHEYTVRTPGSSTRGARRIITGRGGEYFYTADHYASFVLVDLHV
jgi:ribonuclease T1